MKVLRWRRGESFEEILSDSSLEWGMEISMTFDYSPRFLWFPNRESLCSSCSSRSLWSSCYSMSLCSSLELFFVIYLSSNDLERSEMHWMELCHDQRFGLFVWQAPDVDRDSGYFPGTLARKETLQWVTVASWMLFGRFNLNRSSFDFV